MVGELVMERFRLEERIGSGGMGTVYRAFDERLQRHVAVKEVMVGAPDRVAREAHAAARLNHPGIVALFEFGIDGHRALLVSELITGETLDVLARDGVLCDRDVAELGADVCEALEHAHERGVVHRDIKPQNIIARDDTGSGRRAKLADFGIASLAGAPTLTAPGEVVGTLAYMSPEQSEGMRAGSASDVYSLALTLYECWAGENPVRGATPAETARAMGEPLPPLSAYRPDLPNRLCATVDACLEPDPDERPALEVLRHTLDAAAGDLDCDYAVPPPAGAEGERKPGLAPRPAALRAGLALGLAAACVVLAGPIGVPGVALLVGLLGFPALAFATSPERAGAAGRGNRPRRRVGRRRLSGPRRRGRAHNDGAPRPRRAGLVLAADRVRRARHRSSGRTPRTTSGQLGRLAWHHLRRPSSSAPRARVVDRDGRLRDRCRDPRARPREQASGDGRVRFAGVGRRPHRGPAPGRGWGNALGAPDHRGLCARRPRRGAAAPLARQPVPASPSRRSRTRFARGDRPVGASVPPLGFPPARPRLSGPGTA